MRLSTSGRASLEGKGVTRPTHRDDSSGVSTGTATTTRRGRPATSAYVAIISRYVNTSGPPTSITSLRAAVLEARPTSQRSTSRTEMGWQRLSTQRGVTIAGRTSTRYRSISKLADPDPMMSAARSSVTGTGPSARTRPTA